MAVVSICSASVSVERAATKMTEEEVSSRENPSQTSWAAAAYAAEYKSSRMSSSADNESRVRVEISSTIVVLIISSTMLEEANSTASVVAGQVSS